MSTFHGRCRRWMSRALAGAVLLTGGLSLACGQDAVRKEQPQVARNYVKKASFRLPLKIAESTKSQVREIRLYCKAPTAVNWVLLEACPPTKTGFDFQAERDGEYLFAMTVVDKAGRSIPADPEQSLFRMAVVVDMQPPTADVQLVQATEAGPVIQVDVHDANMDPSMTQVHYQTKDMVWRTLDPLPQQANRYCIPVQAATTGLVRVSASDLAGNILRHEVDLGQNMEQKVSSAGDGVKVAASSGAPKGNDTPPLAPPFANPTPAGGAFSAQSLKVNTPVASAGVIDVSVANGGIPLPLPSQPTMDKTNSGTIIPAGAKFTNQTIVAPSKANSPIVQVEAVPTVSPQGVPSIPEVRPISVSAKPSAPEAPGIDRRVINHVQMLLAYKVEEVGASGVGKVEVWITRDQSKNWHKFCEDTQCKSPVAVELPGEGLYGITLVVSNGRGFGGVPPKPGDAPDAWVEVDLTRPTAELTNVRTGSGPDAGALIISWTAKDRNLSAECVELFYSNTRDGNWQPIAKGLKNEGNYRWMPPVSVGQQCFLRLVIRDLAGNSTVIETPQAISVDDMSRPRGRLVGILPYTPEIRLDPMAN